MAKKGAGKGVVYQQVISDVFLSRYKAGVNRLEFTRDDLFNSIQKLGFELKGEEKIVAKNLGDIVYTFRFRKDFPPEILRTAPKNKMWIITGKGDARYEFRLITTPSLDADPDWFVTKIHDATPEIVRRFALNDEQAVLARIRYNRLVDLFCKCVAHSLQNHLRTKVEGIGQIEIDELYVGVNRHGEHFVIPVQVKREGDRLGVSQLLQDLEYCRRKHPEMQARALGAQMLRYQDGERTFDRIVLFEFQCEDTGDDVSIRKIQERHFALLPFTAIAEDDFEQARKRGAHDLPET